MTRVLATLRAIGLIGVTAAIVDPGCVQVRRPALSLRFAGQIPSAAMDRIHARLVSGTRAWADLETAASADEQPEPPPVGADLHVVVGDAAPVLAAIRETPAALAVQVADPAIAVVAVHVPPRVASGTRATVRVSLAGIPRGAGTVTLLAVDRTSGREMAHATVDTTAVIDGTVRAEIPWLALHDGRQVVRVMASYSGPTAARPAAPADVTVEVVPSQVRVEAIEARPAWGVRFARLALARMSDIEVLTEVRVAPGIAVRTGAGAAASRLPSDAAVLLVGGVDALTEGEVSRFEREVRDRGRALVLVLDEPPGGGAWRRLWPEPLGPARASATPLPTRVAGHVWKAREWLSPALSTRVLPLAYLDSGRQPVVSGRALGAGRVVLVSALDPWRWRADEGTAFAQGWQALVRSLAADVPPPVGITTWASGHGRHRAVHLDATVRPDQLSGGEIEVSAEVAGHGAPRPVPLFPAGWGRWRGAWRVWDGSANRVTVRVVRRGEVVGSGRAVVDVSPTAPTAGWAEVERHQRERRGLTATEATMPEALRALRDSVSASRTDRWFLTRTWWYAGLVLTTLGSEWILRRARRRR
jgi:hypothetical protein